MKQLTIVNPFKGLGTFLLLWATQALSALGSSMTGYALVVWSYQRTGSALSTSLLSVCSYAPYVLLSIFAGAYSDKWDKRRTMLVCDSFAALTTVAVLILLLAGRLEIWHLYLINAAGGLMNTLQQPATDVAVTLLTPKEQYQRVSGLRSFSNSLVTILTPVIATAVLSFWGLGAVIAFDLLTFAAAFMALFFFIRIPPAPRGASGADGSVFARVREGLRFLRQNRRILDLMLFLAGINLTASMYNAALPAMLLSRAGAGTAALGLVNACAGAANIAGSILVSFAAPPKNRMRALFGALFFSMSTENFFLAFGKSTPVWCAGAILGWLFIPVMNANLDVILRTGIPVEIQGRVFSVRNSLQFFTIPIGYLLGGVLVDKAFEPFMAGQAAGSPLCWLFGSGKGAGAAMFFFFLGILGVVTCFIFRCDPHLKKDFRAEP